MPPVIIAAGYAAYVGTAVAWATAALTAVSYGFSQYQASRARKKARDAYNNSVTDRLVMTATVDQARSRILGRARNVDGILFKATRGDKKQYYTLVVAIAGHEVDAFEQHMFGDVPLSVDANGWVQTAPWNGAETDTGILGIAAGIASGDLGVVPDAGSVRVVAVNADGSESAIAHTLVGSVVTPDVGFIGQARQIVYQATTNKAKARIRAYNGTDGQDLSAELAADFPALITPGAHRFAGIACLRVDLEYSQDAFSGGVPNPISSVVRGAKVLDWRVNQAPDPFFADAVVGGVPGTGWSVAGGSGITVAVVGTGVEAGLVYVDLRFSGAATAAITPRLQIATGSRPATGIPQAWYGGMFVRQVSGSAPVQPRLQIIGRSSASASVEGVSIAADAATLARSLLTQCRVTGSATLANASSVTADLALSYTLSTGQALDVTLRVALPTLAKSRDAFAFSENPSLHAWDWSVYKHGGGRSPRELNRDDFTVAANACDIEHTFTSVNGDGVTVNAGRALYTSGIVCNTEANPDETLSSLCEAMAGEFAWPGGRLSVYAGVFTASVGTITADWLTDKAGIQLVKDGPRAELVNVITPTIANAANAYVAAPIPRIPADAYIAVDGEEYPQELVYEAVTDSDHAAHIAGVMMRDARAAKTITLALNLMALQCKFRDTWTINIPELGLVNELMRVTLWKLMLSKGYISVTFKATSASIFDPDATFLRSDALPNTALPMPWVVPDMGTLTLASGTAHLLKQSDGTIVSRLKVSWPAVADAGVQEGGQIELRYGLSSTPEAQWQSLFVPGADTQAYIPAVQDRLAYIVIARARNKLVNGGWSIPYAHTVVGKTAAPAAVVGFALALVAGAVRGTRTPSTEADYSYTSYRYGSSWAAGTKVPGTSDANGFVWPDVPAGAYLIWAADVDTSGNVGTAVSQSITVAVTAERANLLPYGGFEQGITGWSGASAFAPISSAWGPYIGTQTIASGTGAIQHDPIAVTAGQAYTIHGDAQLVATSGVVYFDMLFYNSSGAVLLDGPQNSKAATFDFSDDETNRAIFAVTATAPTGAVTACARFVWQSLVGCTALAVRRVKMERGGLPYSNYSAEAYAVLVQSQAIAAQATASTAAGNASSALSLLATMRSNGYLDASEKPTVIKEWNAIVYEYDGIVASATTQGITTELTAYISCKSALAAYLNGLSPAWNDTTQDTPITPATDQQRWADYYGARQTLLNKLAVLITAGSVGTTELAPGAATDVYTAIATGVSVTGLSGTGEADVFYSDVCSATFVAGETCTVSVSADGAATIVTPSSGSSAEWAVLTTRIKVNGTVLGVKSTCIQSNLGYSQTVNAEFTRALSFSVTKGSTYTVLLQAQKLESTVSTTINRAELKGEVLKR